MKRKQPHSVTGSFGLTKLNSAYIQNKMSRRQDDGVRVYGRGERTIGARAPLSYPSEASRHPYITIAALAKVKWRDLIKLTLFIITQCSR